MGVKGTFGNAREVCRYAREKFNRLVTERDRSSLRRKFPLIQHWNDIARAKELLRGRGFLRLLKWEDADKFAFFVLDGVRHLVHMYCEVLLTGPTHRFNCNGYTLWHAMIVKHSLLGKCIF